MGADCKSAGSAFSGSNPLPTTRTLILLGRMRVHDYMILGVEKTYLKVLLEFRSDLDRTRAGLSMNL